MRDTIYLIFNQRGVKSMTKRPPRLTGGELACKLVINVDNRYFERSIPVANIDLGDHQVITPTVNIVNTPRPQGGIEVQI